VDNTCYRGYICSACPLRSSVPILCSANGCLGSTVERIRYPRYICSTPTLCSNGTVFPLSDSGDNPSTGSLSQYVGFLGPAMK
jgi:hypothetical protein